ncbi:MAG: hypothetical protein ACYSR9_08355 [Planctomycetota bacterium]|jgi:hypothetical protein
MFFLQNNPLSKFRRKIKLRKIANQVRNGVVPRNVDKETIYEALKVTRKPNNTEVFGFLYARHFRDGELVEDLGLQGVKEITSAFTKYLVDGLMDSAIVMDDFDKHAQGDGSTAETDSQTALVNQQSTRRTGTQTHGSTSNIYKSIATITAVAAYTAIEHGIFDSMTATTQIMLDRTLVGSPPNLVTDDEVEWTYELTVNAGG